MNYIYVLLDPRDLSVRYIGITDALKNRMNGHLHPDKYNLGKTAWIQELQMLGFIPVMLIIATARSRKEAQHLEVHFIEECLRQGVRLLNIDIRRPFSHWKQVTGDQPTLFYKVLCADNGYWVVEVVNVEKRFYRLRYKHKVYRIDASAYSMRDRLNGLLEEERDELSPLTEDEQRMYDAHIIP